jgi:hypothetical protein
MNDSSDIRQSVSSAPVRQSKSFTFSQKTLVNILVVIIVAALGFYGGTLYQKHHASKAVVATSTGATTTGGQNGGGRFGGGQGFSGGGFGSVTAISATSITISDTRTGSSTTYAITSSTKITDQGQAVAYTTITAGERVVVIPDSSKSSDAASIVVGGGFGGGAGASQGSDTQGSTTDNTN